MIAFNQRCGNVASILELDENLNKYYKIFEAAPTENRSTNPKKAMADYFLWNKLYDPSYLNQDIINIYENLF